MTTYKGLRKAIWAANNCPMGHHVRFFAKKIKGGYEIGTSGYLCNDVYDHSLAEKWQGWTEITDWMGYHWQMVENYEGRTPSLAERIKVSCMEA